MRTPRLRLLIIADYSYYSSWPVKDALFTDWSDWGVSNRAPAVRVWRAGSGATLVRVSAASCARQTTEETDEPDKISSDHRAGRLVCFPQMARARPHTRSLRHQTRLIRARDPLAGSEWSEPVNLGPVINSGFVEANASLSPNEHTTLLHLDPPGGFRMNDIGMSSDSVWRVHGGAVNLGATINTAAWRPRHRCRRRAAAVFYSTKAGGFGSADIYVVASHTQAQRGCWGEPVNLGPDVNTVAAEQGPYYVKITGRRTRRVLQPGGQWNTDIYKVFISMNGVRWDPRPGPRS